MGLRDVLLVFNFFLTGKIYYSIKINFHNFTYP
jgi:hypothetical protein